MKGENEVGEGLGVGVGECWGIESLLCRFELSKEADLVGLPPVRKSGTERMLEDFPALNKGFKKVKGDKTRKKN
jgi:hypothetical protein